MSQATHAPMLGKKDGALVWAEPAAALERRVRAFDPWPMAFFEGSKGRVHVHFGTPLEADLESPEAVAAEIDRQIIHGFHLHPTNVWAYRELHGEPQLGDLQIDEGSCSEAAFRARIEAMDEAHRPFALAGYANALHSVLNGGS